MVYPFRLHVVWVSGVSAVSGQGPSYSLPWQYTPQTTEENNATPSRGEIFNVGLIAKDLEYWLSISGSPFVDMFVFQFQIVCEMWVTAPSRHDHACVIRGRVRRLPWRDNFIAEVNVDIHAKKVRLILRCPIGANSLKRQTDTDIRYAHGRYWLRF